MKALTCCLLATLFSVSTQVQAGEWIINYCKDLTTEQFRKAAKAAFSDRRYEIEQENPNSVIGVQKGKKVEVAMAAPGKIAIRWVPGFGYKKDNWLKSMKYEMLEKVAGDIKQGEWAINWCRDLTVDNFRRAATSALNKRNYRIEKDTPSSLTAGQKGKKVEISMTTPGRIVIRWVPGAGYDKDNWLKSLYRDITWYLAG